QPSAMETVDLLIVGAGWHGLAMAKTFLEVCPNENVLIVDSAASIGGVWAHERVYPGLKTNNLIGSYEFSDFPMTPEKYGCKQKSHIPGATVHKYLCDAAQHFDITRRVRLKTKVQTARLVEDSSWIVDTVALSDSESPGNGDNLQTILARRLVIATGTTSEPFRPTFVNESTFAGPIVHSKELREQSQVLGAASSIVVVGGNKSAFDVAYTAAQNDTEVHMVMRPSGGGPSWVWPSRFSFFGISTSIARLSFTRFVSWFDPCIWARDSWIRWLLHRTWVGRKLTALFWTLLRRKVERLNGYDKHEALRLLKPWTSPYWMGNSLSANNYEEPWFALARRGKIKIHIGNVESLDERAVHFTDGTVVDADVLVCCTGWKAAPPIRFIPDDIHARLGLPGSIYEPDQETLQADRHIFSLFPDLHEGPIKQIPSPRGRSIQKRPEHQHEGQATTAYRLYRFSVPTDPQFLRYRTIAFAGAHLSVHAIAIAQVQALWITAFFLDRIGTLSIDQLTSSTLGKVRSETVLYAEFERLRRPPEAGGSGHRYPEMVFDSMPYVDMLLQELGIQIYRKGSWWRELFTSYGVRDYKGLVQEWMKSNKLK
ncbi:FAD/NAD(P)-binding domain-containing protein, partial [Rhizodiscina lignyota]